ncbi:MAG: C69 family dipeptidase [Selenomonadaceae bacterium]|nr:C69 family dipeptidase [Selenomonadaceae bacterium]
MERCKTAREAIKLMGALIDEYGLYGRSKTMFVADKDEGWLFEMQPTPSGKGGLWIAEKSPTGIFPSPPIS